ncbi:UNVERIFIED_CONTAM: Homocysteine S-methyltransferase 1 [Sesamum latifolium]|uniref:Homocysteine S-methyltransferase 1 n=1 Tax=Sesamum latifolium TaxID=2727402 RepID=A0AAW2YCF9_9LAMI
MGRVNGDVQENVLVDLIKKSGGCAVVDGGFSTQLEIHGACINDPLWSALCLIKAPDLVKLVHLEYLEAGADVLVTSSYQATIPGFLSRGLSLEEAESLLTKSVRLAVEARDKFWSSGKRKSGHNYNRALVAASIGSYGAYLADGSEYSGNYGTSITLEKLKDFHRRRLQVLVEAGPDLLAFETMPNKLEAQRTAKAIVVYPNSGETWDGTAKTWQPSKCVHDEFELLATTWRDAGAKLIGGCCRTTPSTICLISRVVKDT